MSFDPQLDLFTSEPKPKPPAKCPNCHGTGRTRFGVCAYCRGVSAQKDVLPGETFEDIFTAAYLKDPE